MKKYKITSIPQFAPGGETNWPPDWMLNIMQNQRKVKKLKKAKVSKRGKDSSNDDVEEIEVTEDVTPNQPTVNVPVENITTTTPLTAFLPKESELTQPEQYTIEPSMQDKPNSERTGLEQLATQPMGDFGYGYMKDPFTGKLVVAPVGTPTAEKDIFGNMVTRVQSNPYAPVDAQGNPLNCPPGSRPYNGVCVTDEEFQQLEAEKEANLLYREEQEAKRIAEEERLKAEEEQRLFDAKVKEREVYFQSKKKHDKLDPFDTMPYEVYENALKLNPDFKNQLKQQGFYADVKKDDGVVKLFPVNEINDRILKNGLKTGEIVNKLGIGNTEDIDTEFKDVFEYADDYHKMQSKQFVQDYMVNYNLTLDQAIAKVVKDKGLAKDAATLKKIYNTDFKDIDKNVTQYRKQVENYNTAQRAYKAYGEDYVPPYKKYKGIELRDKWTDDDIITLARDREFLDSYGYNIGIAGAAGYSDNEYGAQIHTLVRSGKWGWKPKTGELVRLDKDPAYKPLAEIADKVVQPEDIQLKKFTKDYLGLSYKDFKSKYRPNSVELQEKWKEGKVPIQIEDVKEWRPYRTYDPNKGVAGTFYQGYYVDVPSHVDPMTGEMVTKKVNIEDLVGQQVYMTPEEAEKYNKNMMRDNMEYFRNSPLYYLPGAIGMGGALLGTANRALSIPLLKAFGSEALPQLTGHTLLNSYFAYEALKPNGQVEQAYKAFKEGDVGKGVENTIWAGLGLAPFVKPSYQMLKAVNELKKPGSLSVLPMSSNYSLAYKTPLQSGLVVGNPNVGNATEAFTGITNPLNKFTKYTNLGEFKIMKQNPKIYRNGTDASSWAQRILSDGKTAVQVVDQAPKTIDTTVPLYRHEFSGYKPSESKTASEYHDWDYGPVSEMDAEELAEALANPASIRYVDQNGIERIGVFFPQHTAGKWWSSQKIGEEGAPHAVNTFMFDPITGEYIDKADEMVHLETNVPFSKLEQYNVANDPAAKEFAGMDPEGWKKQFILPDEYRESAKIYEPFNQSRVPTQGSASVGPAQTQPSVSDLDIDKPIINIDEALKNDAAEIGDAIKNQEELTQFESDNAFTAKVIDDVYKNKIELYQTPEGQKRLQKLIDNTPSLKNETPKTLFRKLASMTNRNAYYEGQAKLKAGLERDIERIEMEYGAGRMSKEQLDAYIAPIQEKINRFEESMKKTQEMFSQMGANGYYNNPTNEVGIKPGAHTVNDIKNITAHEIAHPFAFLGGNDEVTYIDKMLDDLSLIKNTDEQLKIPGIEGVAEETKVHHNMGWGKPGYLKRSLDYFKTGSNGREKMPFLAEVRQDMLNKGIITSEYEPISTEMLQKHYENYKNMQGEKYPLRLYDIIDPKDAGKNFNILKEAINWLPSVVGVGTAATSTLSEDESGASQAGLNEWQFLLLAGALVGGGKVMSPKLRNLFNKYKTKGFETVQRLITSDKKYEEAVNEAKKVYDDLIEYQGYDRNSGFKTTSDLIGPKQLGLIQRQHYAEQDVRKKQWLIDMYVDNKNMPVIETPQGVQKLNIGPSAQELSRQLREAMNQPYYKMEQLYSQNPEGGLEALVPGVFNKTTTTGRTTITDLTTGKEINAEVSYPTSKITYTNENGKLVVKDEPFTQVYMSPEYVESLKNSIAAVESKIPGAKVFGSSQLVSEVGMPHLTADIDLLVTESSFNNNIKNKFKYIGENGPADKYEIFPGTGKDGILDVNIIHENPDGTVRPFWNQHAPDKTPTEIELFRQFYPAEFQKAAQESLISGKPIEINMNAEEFMKGVDPVVKTIIDSYEAGPTLKWGNKSSHKEKHILRPDVLIGYGKPETVAKGQEAFVKSVVGPKGTLGYQFPVTELQDVEKNIDALIAMDFRGDNMMEVAKSPERMQLALNDYYINHTIFSREINPRGVKRHTGKIDDETIKTALTEWFPEANGGTINGLGLNTTRLGNVGHISKAEDAVIGHRQLGIKLDTTDIKTYIKSINRATDGSYALTSDEITDLYNIFSKYLDPADIEPLKNIKKSEELLDWNPSKFIEDFATQNKAKAAFAEFAEKTGIRAISKTKENYVTANNYYASLFGKLDETLDAMMYAAKDIHAAPKSIYERKTQFEKAKTLVQQNNPLTQVPIKTLGDLQRIENIINGGLSTAEQRLRRYEDEVALIKKQKEELLKKAYPEQIKKAEDLENELNKMQKKITDQMKKVQELADLRYKAKQTKNLIKPLIVGGVVVGALGSVMYGLNQDAEKRNAEVREMKKSREIWKNKRGVNEVTTKRFDKETFDYLIKNPNAQTWPNGDSIKIIKGQIDLPTPAQMNKKVDEVSMSDADYYKQYYDRLNEEQKKQAVKKYDFKTTLEKEDSNIKIRKQKLGGQNAMELELTQKEIDDMVKRGYVVIAK